MAQAAKPPIKKSPGGTARKRQPRWVAFAVVAVLAISSYANTLGGALLFDDKPAIIENPWVQRRGPLAVFTEPSWWGPHTGVRGWRPLTTLSFALNYSLHGLHPAGYHVVNVALHAAVSMLLLAVFAQLVPWAAAVIAAALFAVHPVHTEAVASVVGRAELLATAGFLLAWRAFLAADRRAAANQPGAPPVWLLEAGGILAFVAALLAKENALTLVPVLILADLIGSPAGAVATTLRRRLPRYAALFATAALFLWLRSRVTGEVTSTIPQLDNPLVTMAPLARWLTAIAVVGLYAWRLLFPLHLSTDYTAWQIAPVTSPFEARFLAGLVILVAVPAVAWWSRRRAPGIALGLGLMMLTFAIVSNLLFLVGTIMAERWLYLPSIGFCLVVGLLLARRAPAAGLTRAMWLRIALPVAVLVTLAGIRTWTRNRVWLTSDAFFTAMLRDAPQSSRAHASFADVLTEGGRLTEAIREYERALAIEPRNWRAEYNLGNALLKSGKIADAVAAYERALAIEPTYAKAMINLGAAESRRGNTQAGIEWLRRALVLEPNLPSAHTSLANILAASGDRAAARAAYETALVLDPNSPDVLGDFGSFLAASAEHADAIALLRRSLIERPDVAERHYNLGNELALTGELGAAVAAYQRALELRPGFREALENLGNTESLRGNHDAALSWLERARAAGASSASIHMNIANELVRLGRMPEARTSYETALAIEPNSERVRANYAAFLAMQGGAPPAPTTIQP